MAVECPAYLRVVPFAGRLSDIVKQRRPTKPEARFCAYFLCKSVTVLNRDIILESPGCNRSKFLSSNIIDNLNRMRKVILVPPAVNSLHPLEFCKLRQHIFQEFRLVKQSEST